MRIAIAALSVSVLAGSSAAAQVSKTITGEAMTATATVEAIDQSRREVTLKKSDGNYQVLRVPSNVSKFDALKVGDTM